MQPILEDTTLTPPPTPAPITEDARPTELGVEGVGSVGPPGFDRVEFKVVGFAAGWEEVGGAYPVDCMKALPMK